MPDLAKPLKEEIQRLARKEARSLTRSPRKVSVALKRTMADQKRRIARLERNTRGLVIENSDLFRQSWHHTSRKERLQASP